MAIDRSADAATATVAPIHDRAKRPVISKVGVVDLVAEHRKGLVACPHMSDDITPAALYRLLDSGVT
jgi:hypothetical protein